MSLVTFPYYTIETRQQRSSASFRWLNELTVRRYTETTLTILCTETDRDTLERHGWSLRTFTPSLAYRDQTDMRIFEGEPCDASVFTIQMRMMAQEQGVSLTSSSGPQVAYASSAVQDWVHTLTRMQQSVLFSAIRGPDGVEKFHPVKHLLRYYRRCVLLSAFDGKVLETPWALGGGSFTGPSCQPITGTVDPEDGEYNDNDNEPYWVPGSPAPRDLVGQAGEAMRYAISQRTLSELSETMAGVVDLFMKASDGMPAHFWLHVMHAFEILGYKHPTPEIRAFWHSVYLRMVHAFHLWPETEAQLDARLGDDEAGWAARADDACVCSD